MLRAVYYPAPPPPLLARSSAIRNKEKARHLVFFLFVSLAQTTPAQPAGGTSPSVGLLVPPKWREASLPVAVPFHGPALGCFCACALGRHILRWRRQMTPRATRPRITPPATARPVVAFVIRFPIPETFQFQFHFQFQFTSNSTSTSTSSAHFQPAALLRRKVDRGTCKVPPRRSRGGTLQVPSRTAGQPRPLLRPRATSQMQVIAPPSGLARLYVCTFGCSRCCAYARAC